MEVKQCLKLLEKKPYKRKNTPCYHLLQFPDQKLNLHIKPNVEYLDYLVQVFPRRVAVTKAILVDPNSLEFRVPNKLLNQLKGRGTGFGKAFTITPILISSKSSPKSLNNSNVYALLQDRREKIWTIFMLPGSHLEPNSPDIEHKLLTLLEDKFKLPVLLYYTNINYTPKPGTFHYPWWPSWMIYHTIKKLGSEREEIVDKALGEILLNDPNYQKFVNGFIEFIKEH